MAVDLKSEATRPLVLLLAPLALLGWVLFGLESWTSAAAQKTQRQQIMRLTETRDALSEELTGLKQSTAALGDLQGKLQAMKDDLTRVRQVRDDVQTEISTVQKDLTTRRRDLTELDRTIAATSSRAADTQSTASVDEAEPQPESFSRSSKRYRGARHRGRYSRSFRVRRH